MRLARGLAALSLALLSGGAAFAGGKVPDGEYDCMSEMGALMGTIRIDGDTFAGPAYDGHYEGSYPFTATDSTINWGGPLGGFDTGGNQVSSTVLRDYGFDVIVHTSGGNFERISCDRR